MDIIVNVITSIIFSIIDVYLIEYYFSKLFIKNKNFNFYLYYVIETFLFVLININLFRNIVVNFFIILLIIFISVCKFKLSKLQLLINLLIILLIKTSFPILTRIFFEWLFDTSITTLNFHWVLSYQILSLFIERYSEFLLISLMLNKIDKNDSINHFFKILTIVLFVYFSTTIIMNNNELFYFPRIGRSFVCIILAFIFILNGFDYYQRKHHKIEKNLLITTERITFQKKSLEDKLKNDKEIRRIKHDLINNYSILQGYILSNNQENALNFIAKQLGDLNKFSSLVHVDEPCIDCVINNKLSIMKQKNILYCEDITNMCIGKIDVDDLALLIGIALDNAIEATNKNPSERKITFHSHNKNNFLSLRFVNTIPKGARPNFNKTSKLINKEYHGFGIKQIKYIINQYNGNMNYEIQNDKVILKISLCIS